MDLSERVFRWGLWLAMACDDSLNTKLRNELAECSKRAVRGEPVTENRELVTPGRLWARAELSAALLTGRLEL